MNQKLRFALPALFAATALALAGCANDAPKPEAEENPSIKIVASTNVYADIARTVAGDGIEVSAIIDDLRRDPHEYEASSRDALTLAEADVVVMNGGGYDGFMDTLLAAQDKKPEIISAVALSGLDPDAKAHDHEHDHDHGDDHGDDGEEHDHENGEEHAAEEHEHEDGEEHDHDHEDGEEHDHADEDGHHHHHGSFNEHVWYHLHTVSELAHSISHTLGHLLPEQAADFEHNAHTFMDGVSDLEKRAKDLGLTHAGANVAITEPVPLHLLELIGLKNLTPAEFSEAVEEGNDAPALVVQEMLEIVVGKVNFLAYNEQTTGPQTEQVRAAAEEANIPVVFFTELLPEGLNYLSWMSANLDSIEEALR